MGADIILWATTADGFDPSRLAAHPDARDILEPYTDTQEAHARAAALQADGWRVRLLRVAAEYVPAPVEAPR